MIQKNYVMGMDDVFTFHHILIVAKELGVMIFGIESKVIGCLPKQIMNISDRQFNTLHLINDERNFQIQQWIDQNVVTMITKLHTLEDANRRIRKKPRVDQANKNYLELVWGTEYCKIKIPRSVHDYNHWVVGFDM